MANQIRVFQFIALLFVLFILLGANSALAGVEIGVKKGDWIEYEVSTTGNPEEGHNVTWARLEVIDIKGTEISVNVSTRSRNGTYASEIDYFNPPLGNVGIWFVIPPNLSPGEAFFDASENRNVTIEGSMERSIAGATRTVTHATTPERIKSWDKATGVFVESIDVLPNSTLNAIANKTNMWSEQILGIDKQLFYYSISVAAVVLITLVLVLRKVKKSK